MIVTATQIQLKGLVGFLRFFIHVRKVRAQLDQADGLRFVRTRGLRTLTGWESRDAMKAFRNSGHHLDAMRNIRRVGRARSITWETETEPDWNEALEKLRAVRF